MKFWRAFVRGRHPFALLAGVVWALAFPQPGVAGFAWLAPALLCFAAAGREGWRAWRTGFVGGLTFYLITLHWLLFIPVTGAPILGWVLLSAYTALYTGTWLWLCSELFAATCGRPQEMEHRPPARLVEGAGQEHAGAETGAPPTLRTLALSLHNTSWPRRLAWTLAGAAAWVAVETVYSRFLTGFPWNLLGVSQYRITPLIQMASVTGVWGVSFLIVWFSLSLLCVGAVVIARPAVRSAWLPEIIVPMLVIGGLFGLGFRQATAPEPAKRTLKIALIQPSIPQTVIWDARENATRFDALIRLTERALTNQPDLVIWPEAAVPQLLRYDAPTARAVADLARSNHVWLIAGGDDAEPRSNPQKPDDANWFNAAFLVSPAGELAATYHKRRLVIFGEYIPFERWLPFLKWFTPIEGGFATGPGPVPFDLRGHDVRTSVLICFEDMFSQLGRAAMRDDPDFLVNLTNDGWFGESAQHWQQAASAVFRAVENRVPLVRCTNNGLTCWIDEFGRLRATLDSTARGIYGEGFLIANVEFPERNARGSPTFFRRYGDWFGWLCVALTAARLLLILRPKPRRKRPQS